METNNNFLSDEQIIKMLRKDKRVANGKIKAVEEFVRDLSGHIMNERETMEDKRWHSGFLFALYVMEDILKMSNEEIRKQIECLENWEYKEDLVPRRCCENCIHYKWPGCEVKQELLINGRNCQKLTGCRSYVLRDTPTIFDSKE